MPVDQNQIHMFERDFHDAARDVIAGAIGGLLSYWSLQNQGVPEALILAVFGFLLILGVAAFYYGIRWARALGVKHYERLNDGQPERTQHDWPENRAS